MGLTREKRYSEGYLSVILLSQVLIPTVIPLFHPIATISIIVGLSCLNLIMLFRIRIMKIFACTYLRISNQVFFILFNLIFVVYYLIETHYSKLSLEVTTVIGFASIGALVLTSTMEIVETVTEICVDAYRLVRRVCGKKRVQQLTSKVGDSGVNLQVTAPLGTQGSFAKVPKSQDSEGIIQRRVGCFPQINISYRTSHKRLHENPFPQKSSRERVGG